jgi:uncharacterized membrane protein
VTSSRAQLKRSLSNASAKGGCASGAERLKRMRPYNKWIFLNEISIRRGHISQRQTMTKKNIAARVMASGSALILLLLASLAPVAMSDAQSEVAMWLYKCFSPVCHQKPHRSILLFGFPMAVCARCAAIYAGVSVGALLLPMLTKQNRTLYLAGLFVMALLTVLDVGLHFAGIYGNIFSIRISLGFLLGVPVGGIVASAAAEWLCARRNPAFAR